MKWRVCTLLVLCILICFALLGCEDSEHDEGSFKPMEFESIDELHAEYVKNCYLNESFGRKYWPRDLVTHFIYEDKCFLVCTYTEKRNDSFVKDGALVIYPVAVSGDKFVLDTQYLELEIAAFSIGEENPENNPIGIVEIGGELQHISFVCKKQDEERCYYYDGVRMSELDFTDPFSNEKISLCYGVSDSLTQLQNFFGYEHKWQLLPDSPTNYIEHRIVYDQNCIKIAIEIPTMPTSDEFLIEYTNILADEIEEFDKQRNVLNGGKVDRRQLYSEIKFHIVCWNWGLVHSKTARADIEIFEGGEVIDSRAWLNFLALSLYGDEYKEL